MYGDTQNHKPPKDKHYRHVGRTGVTVGGLPYWEMFNGVNFGPNYGWDDVDPQVQQSGQISGEESNESAGTDTASGSDSVGSASTGEGVGAGPV